MNLSRKFNILRKLYFFGHISRKDLTPPEEDMINEVKTEMRKEREGNNEEMHHIQVNNLLSKNNISPGEEEEL